MNFAHYYNILQQIEKPTFVFDKFERENFIIYLKELEDYLTEQGADGAIKRQNYNITVELLQQSCKSYYARNEENYYPVKFYENESSYLFYTTILYDNKYYEHIVKASTMVENSDKDGLKQLYKGFMQQNDIILVSFLDIIDISRRGKYFVFKTSTTEKDYFTLEIIAVIHKVIA
jgi:hypothetical protein